MRKHDVRKFIHAICDLLPLILIPVFMVFSHRHDVAEDVTYTEQVPVYYETNEVNETDDILIGNYYHWSDNYTYVLGQTQMRFLRIVNDTNIRTQLNISDIYNDCELWFINNNTINQLRIDFMRNNSYADGLTLSGQEFDFCVMSIINQGVLSSYISSINECQTLYVKEYQDVTTIVPQNVMDAFVNQLHLTIDKYFNFNQVQPFGDLYNTIVNNFFGGVSPLGLHIVWNVVLFEFFMDVLFLVYMVFMFIIDFTESMIDKAFYKSNRGCL